MKEKCYHMTKHLQKILSDKKPQLKPIVGGNSEYVNDKNNIGISYSLGLEGIIATNAMFHARYQYEKLEKQTDRNITLDDMFKQDIKKEEENALGDNVYLNFYETEAIRSQNMERDIADPKTKFPIDLENIRGVILKNTKTGEIKYDRDSIIMYAVSKVDKEFFKKLNCYDKPFMNMDGYGKTDFSFKEYIERYYEEILKSSQMNEFLKGKYELQEIDVKQMLELVENNKIKQTIDRKDIFYIAKKREVVMEREISMEILEQLEKNKEKTDKDYFLE